MVTASFQQTLCHSVFVSRDVESGKEDVDVSLPASLLRTLRALGVIPEATHKGSRRAEGEAEVAGSPRPIRNNEPPGAVGPPACTAPQTQTRASQAPTQQQKAARRLILSWAQGEAPKTAGMPGTTPTIFGQARAPLTHPETPRAQGRRPTRSTGPEVLSGSLPPSGMGRAGGRPCVPARPWL